MFRIIIALVWLALALPCQAQMTTLGAGGTKAAAAAAYSGPGDVSAAAAWWGLRAYSSAKTGTKIANVCNSGDANCADINSLANGNFDVTTAQGSPLNCGGAGGTCTIKTLYDQSGANSCSSAACDVTNATAANRPTLVFNCLNTSLPCMAGNGSQTLSNTTGMGGKAQPFSGAHVANRTPTATSSQGILGINPALWRYDATNTVSLYSGSPILTATASDASFHSLIGVTNGASSEWVIDGTTTTGTVGGSGTNIGATILLFEDPFSNILTGRIAEAGFWTISLDSVKTTMCHNQRIYWGTSGSC